MPAPSTPNHHEKSGGMGPKSGGMGPKSKVLSDRPLEDPLEE